MHTDNPETMMMVIRQILEYYFVQMVGYHNVDLRRNLLDKHEKEFTKEDYVAASTMIAMINVGATGFNDGLYYDSSAANVSQLRSVFERIFSVKIGWTGGDPLRKRQPTNCQCFQDFHAAPCPSRC